MYIYSIKDVGNDKMTPSLVTYGKKKLKSDVYIFILPTHGSIAVTDHSLLGRHWDTITELYPPELF